MVKKSTFGHFFEEKMPLQVLNKAKKMGISLSGWTIGGVVALAPPVPAPTPPTCFSQACGGRRASLIYHGRPAHIAHSRGNFLPFWGAESPPCGITTSSHQGLRKQPIDAVSRKLYLCDKNKDRPQIIRRCYIK